MPATRLEWHVRVLRVPHARTRLAGRTPALLCRAARSPAADKGTATAAPGAPPAHAGERILLVFAFVLRVSSWALREPHVSTQSMPGGTLCRAGPRASAHEFPVCATEHSCGTEEAHASTHSISSMSMGVLDVSARSPDLSSSSTECE